MLNGLRRHQLQLRLSGAGHVGEEQGNQITSVPVAVAGNNNAGAIQLGAAARDFERQVHLGPRFDGFKAAKFDTVFANFHSMRRQRQT